MRVRHKSYGQSVVELTLTLPLLLMIIFGMVDFTLAYTTNVFIRSAVAEGGYYASQHPSDDQGIRDRIKHELSNLNPAVTDTDIAISTCVAGSSGPQTEITVTYNYHVLFGLAGTGPTITLHNGTVVPQFGGCH
ncbi:MAG: TadE/TadG family type IV pilus assembly protein [Chloroflexales bacterium]